jgi:hypothetical protein
MLVSIFKDYERPNDKIHQLAKEGVIQSIKKGLYVVGPALNIDRRPEPFLLANHILGLLRSKKAAKEFLLENMRMDEAAL